MEKVLKRHKKPTLAKKKREKTIYIKSNSSPQRRLQVQLASWVNSSKNFRKEKKKKKSQSNTNSLSHFK